MQLVGILNTSFGKSSVMICRIVKCVAIADTPYLHGSTVAAELELPLSCNHIDFGFMPHAESVMSS
jgi:hypothetical protein